MRIYYKSSFSRIARLADWAYTIHRTPVNSLCRSTRNGISIISSCIHPLNSCSFRKKSSTLVLPSASAVLALVVVSLKFALKLSAKERTRTAASFVTSLDQSVKTIFSAFSNLNVKLVVFVKSLDSLIFKINSCDL